MDVTEYLLDQDKLMERLAVELEVEEVPDEVRGHVQGLQLDYNVIMESAIGNRGKESWRELIEEAKDRLRKSLEDVGIMLPPGRAKGEGTRDPSPEIEVEPSEATLKRAEAFREVAFTLAGHHPAIHQFRRMHLRGRLLTDEEARTFLDRRCDGPLRTTHGTKAVSRKLWKLAEKLSKTYLWREGDAVWYVLTGYNPPVRPLEVRADIDQAVWYDGSLEHSSGTSWITAKAGDSSRTYRPSTARITITADASVEAGEVERAFRDAQRQILGGDARPAQPQTLEAARFVARRMQACPAESWEQRLRIWNETRPEEWRHRNFRALRQAFERIAYRKYNIPNYLRPARTPFQAYRDDWIEGRKNIC